MKIFITGVTGLVGRALALRLARDGHELIGWVRNEGAARAVLGDSVRLVSVGDNDDLLAEALGESDAVINLAGAPVSRRWSADHRRALVHSRVDLTQRLVAALRDLPRRPSVLLSASAVGFYGDRGDERLDEGADPGDGFLSKLCVDWEAAALEAQQYGLRVATLRIGLVLDGEGGALAAMRPPFGMGLGAVIGSGRQMMPFIHLHDLVEMFVRALVDDRFAGPFNATAPTPVSNREFSRALGRALGRPVLLRAPAIAMRLALGEAAAIVLHGQRAVPQRAQSLGFEFRFPTVDGALRDALDGGRSSVHIGPAVDPPPGDYLRERRPRYLLEQRTSIDAPLPEVFEFFRKAENLGAMTPPALAFEIRTPTPIEMERGRTITYRIRLGPAPMRWLTRIEAWEPGHRFVDAQMRGPYRCWYHEHVFEADGTRTHMVDRVWYAPPLGLLGRMAQVLMVGPMLRRIFGHRRSAIALRFGLAGRRRGAPAGTPPLRAAS